MSGLSRLYRGESNIDFIGRRKVWFAISAFVLVASIAMLLTAKLNYGIEFRGGVSIQAPLPSDAPLADEPDRGVVAEVRSVLEGVGADDAQIQVATEDAGRIVLVQTKEISDPAEQEQVIDAVREATGADPGDIASERVGSKWGGEITDKAVRALVIFMIVILAFISWRFEWKMAVAAVAALVHDLLITAGVYAAVGFEVTPSTVIAILTILGYSLYDTVVVFDKVEENTSALATGGKMTYSGAANLAMNQVFMRSLNTSLTTLLPVAALLFVGAGLFGATTLKDLALALFVGIGAGTYSSIFVATPILVTMKETEPRYRDLREKSERLEARAAKKEEDVEVAETETETQTGTPVEVGARAAAKAPTKRTASSRPAGSKKRKRRKR